MGNTHAFGADPSVHAVAPQGGVGEPDPAHPAVGTQVPRPPKPHPLFPPVDDAPGSEEEREIKFVTFVRQIGDAPATNCPGDIPADDVTDWDQVTAWWGGGAYKAIAKDEKHRILRYFPAGGSEWMMFEGESLPF